MYYDIPSHPAVAAALRTGYPAEPEPPLLCRRCGREISGGQDTYHLCAACARRALEILVAFLYTFSPEELAYLDACLDGTSILEPGEITSVAVACC